VNVTLQPAEEEALFVVLRAREEQRRTTPALPGAPDPLEALLRRLEKALFERMTIDELEALPLRYPDNR